MRLSFGEIAKRWVGVASEIFLVLLMVQNSFVLLMLVHDASLIDIQRAYVTPTIFAMA
jgi:hypothetical protein